MCWPYQPEPVGTVHPTQRGYAMKNAVLALVFVSCAGSAFAVADPDPDGIGIWFELSADTTGKSESGPASFVVTDPDGNPVLFDQHR